MRKALPAEEVEKWGRYESSLIFHMSLVFEDGSTVCADDKDLVNFCFKAPLDNAKLLIPNEKPIGEAGYYEQSMARGKVEWRFLTNNNLTSFSLVSSRKNTMFAFKVEALCPYLKNMEPMTVRSAPLSSSRSSRTICRRRSATSRSARKACLPRRGRFASRCSRTCVVFLRWRCGVGRVSREHVGF